MSVTQHTTEDLLQIQEFASPTLDQLSWFAVQTRPRFEKKIAAELQEKGFEAFLPTHSSLRQWSDRRRLIQMPLFPGYVFVRARGRLESRITILRTNGVTSFVGVRGIGTSIPDEEIAAIRTVLKENIPFEPYPFLRVGQRVRIRGGSLDGIKGILTGVRGDQSLVISVELIQRSITIRVSGYQVEAA